MNVRFLFVFLAGFSTVVYAFDAYHDVSYELTREIIHDRLNSKYDLKNINETDRDGKTYLYKAVEDNKLEDVFFLLSRGADPNKYGETVFGDKPPSPLTLSIDAIGINREEITYLLIASGANVNVIDKRGGNEVTPLHVAIVRNQARTSILLMAAGADVNKMTSRGESPLLLAYKEKWHKFHRDEFLALIHSGADINKINSDGQSLSQLLKSNDDKETYEFLRRNGIINN